MNESISKVAIEATQHEDNIKQHIERHAGEQESLLKEVHTTVQATQIAGDLQQTIVSSTCQISQDVHDRTTVLETRIDSVDQKTDSLRLEMKKTRQSLKLSQGLAQHNVKQVMKEVRGIKTHLQGNAVSRNRPAGAAPRNGCSTRGTTKAIRNDFVVPKRHAVSLATTVDFLRLDLKRVLDSLCTSPEIGVEQADMSMLYEGFQLLHKKSHAAASKHSDQFFFLPEQNAATTRSLRFPDQWKREYGWKADSQDIWTLSWASKKSQEWEQLSYVGGGRVLISCRKNFEPGRIQMRVVFTPKPEKNLVSFLAVVDRPSQVQVEPSIRRSLTVFKTFTDDEQWPARDAIMAGDLLQLRKATSSSQGSVWDRDEEGNSLLYVSSF